MQRQDALTQALKTIIASGVATVNAAWATLAATATYTAGTFLSTDILVGDRMKPPEGRITLCVMSDSEAIGLDETALGYFTETASRKIRGYVDLQESDESASRETERERVRDTIRGAVVDILLASTNQTVTDSAGYYWQECYPTGSDTGEVRKDNKTYWAFEITWQATTQGVR